MKTIKTIPCHGGQNYFAHIRKYPSPTEDTLLKFTIALLVALLICMNPGGIVGFAVLKFFSSGISVI